MSYLPEGVIKDVVFVFVTSVVVVVVVFAQSPIFSQIPFGSTSSSMSWIIWSTSSTIFVHCKLVKEENKTCWILLKNRDHNNKEMVTALIEEKV